MITMQYSFTFPADYDMDIIKNRVKDKGNALDKHEPLIFKAYLIAVKGNEYTKSNENIYAPFYLWKDTQGMSDFITGKGFKGLVQSFGQPIVNNWPCIIKCSVNKNIHLARYATKEIKQINAYLDFDEIQKEEEALFDKDINENRALAAISAFEPKSWTLIRFYLWEELNQNILERSVQAYNVLHISYPKID
jgi:hypothetical protein